MARAVALPYKGGGAGTRGKSGGVAQWRRGYGDADVEENREMNSNQLKMAAAVAMVADHIGFFIFPKVLMLRLIGRLAFPIFAYFILEGCHHTQNKLRYLLRVAVLALLCMIPGVLFDGEVYGNILVTFSLSIVMIYELELMGRCKEQGKSTAGLFGMLMIFAATVALTFLLCRIIEVDYGFFGVLTPVFAEITSMIFGKRVRNDHIRERLLPLTGFTVGLICTALNSSMGAIQFYSLLTLPLLMLYNGKRGEVKMGTFFYLFYPIHISLIQLAAMAIN